MFKTIRSAAAAAFVAMLGVSATQPAAAFVAPTPDAIIAASSFTSTVSCGGVDCDAPSQRGYTFYGRYKGAADHGNRRNRWRDSKSRRFRSQNRFDREPRHYDRRWRQHREQRQVRRAVQGLITTFIDRGW